MKQVAYILLLAPLLLSCGGMSSKKVVKEFFEAVKVENESKMKELYPDIENLSSYKKSDKISIMTTSKTDKGYEVVLTNSYTNGFGKATESQISMYVKQKDDGTWIIYDSKGLTTFDSDDKAEKLYQFALNTGCIKGVDMTDQVNAEGIKKAMLLLAKFISVVEANVERNCVVKDWSWESNDYSDSAYGQGIVVNNSDYPLKNIKYKVTYKDRNGNVVTSDNGYVTYDELPEGSSISFSFYTSYVGNASRARIELNFDREWLAEYIMGLPYDGTEYEYLTKNEN